ncbi:MAG: hypothetical protein ACREGE_00055 [Candidatus Microsaccharimonas sp.]
MEQPKNYNELLQSVTPPKTLMDVSLDSEDVVEVRNAFFGDVRQRLEKEFSHGALFAALSVQRIISPPQRGRAHVDMSDELTLVSSIHHPSPLAIALETSEHGMSVVTFSLVPIHKFGNRALQALKQADEAFSIATFHD